MSAPWIHIEDRHPDYGQRVFIYVPARTMDAGNGETREIPETVDIEYYAGVTSSDGHHPAWGCDFDGYREEADFPTLWMPLPDLPVRSESDDLQAEGQEGSPRAAKADGLDVQQVPPDGARVLEGTDPAHDHGSQTGSAPDRDGRGGGGCS